MNKIQMLTLNRVLLILTWRTTNADNINYYSFSSISQAELDLICKAVNATFAALGSQLAVTNQMGEIFSTLSSQLRDDMEVRPLYTAAPKAEPQPADERARFAAWWGSRPEGEDRSISWIAWQARAALASAPQPAEPNIDAALTRALFKSVKFVDDPQPAEWVSDLREHERLTREERAASAAAPQPVALTDEQIEGFAIAAGIAPAIADKRTESGRMLAIFARLAAASPQPAKP